MWTVTFEPADGTKTQVFEYATQAEALAGYDELCKPSVGDSGKIALEAPDGRELKHIYVH